ncbi:hypothetical protein VP01_5175g1, partial [Puccinia sorghi]
LSVCTVPSAAAAAAEICCHLFAYKAPTPGKVFSELQCSRLHCISHSCERCFSTQIAGMSPGFGIVNHTKPTGDLDFPTCVCDAKSTQMEIDKQANILACNDSDSEYDG